jgi:hypothetical protein
MKKSILILLMALFASFQIFAQTPHDPPTCTGSASAPAVGVDYTYEVTVPNTGGYTGTGNYTWYVTQNVNLLDPSAPIPNVSGEFIASGAGAYNMPIPGADVIIIQWTSVALADGQPYYLVIKYDEAAVCTPTNNVKVYRILPQNTFWLKVDNITVEQCAPAVVSATITDTGDPGSVTYVYGTNTLTVLETASGYTGLFDPAIKISGLLLDQTILSVTWAAAAPSTATGTFTGSVVGGVYTSTGSSNQMPSLATGQAITITIVLDNVHFETLADQLIDIAIDGQYVSGASTFKDLSNVNGNCTPETDWADLVTQTISARPTISPVTPAGFVPKAP